MIALLCLGPAKYLKFKRRERERSKNNLHPSNKICDLRSVFVFIFRHMVVNYWKLVNVA